MHVIKVERVGDARYIFCECGRALALLRDGCYSDAQLSDVIQGHRQHVFSELGFPDVWREGSTTQRHAPIDPPAEPDLKPALTQGTWEGQTDWR